MNGRWKQLPKKRQKECSGNALVAQRLTPHQHPNLGPRRGATKTRSRGYPRRPRHRQEGVKRHLQQVSKDPRHGVEVLQQHHGNCIYASGDEDATPFSFVSLDLDGLDAR